MRGELCLEPADEVLRERFLALDVTEKTLDDTEVVVDKRLNMLGVALRHPAAGACPEFCV